MRDLWTEIKCLWKRVKKLEKNGGGGQLQDLQSVLNEGAKAYIIEENGPMNLTPDPNNNAGTYTQIFNAYSNQAIASKHRIFQLGIRNSDGYLYADMGVSPGPGEDYLNSYYGAFALAAMPSDSTLISTSRDNVAYGRNALTRLTLGGYNAATGTDAGVHLVTGNRNTFFGNKSGQGISEGDDNTFVGRAIFTNPTILSKNVILADGTGTSNGIVFRTFEDGATVVPRQTLAGVEHSSGKGVVTKEYLDNWLLTESLPEIVITPGDSLRLKLNADLTISSNIRENIPGFSFPVESGKAYKIEILGGYTTAAATTGGSMGFVLSNSGEGTIFGTVQGNIVATVAAAPEQTITTINDVNTTPRSFLTTTGIPAGVTGCIKGSLIFTCTVDGTFNVQWGSEINGSGATLLANTILEITEI